MLWRVKPPSGRGLTGNRPTRVVLAGRREEEGADRHGRPISEGKREKGVCMCGPVYGPTQHRAISVFLFLVISKGILFEYG
jgi:hypothetical protein